MRPKCSVYGYSSSIKHIPDSQIDMNFVFSESDLFHLLFVPKDKLMLTIFCGFIEHMIVRIATPCMKPETVTFNTVSEYSSVW